MKVLITAGGTSEKIDDVRSITNHSTGSLGSLIAEAFLENSIQVDYVTTEIAKKPASQKDLTVHSITDTRSLAETLETLLKENTYAAVIHSMAVSDFTPTQSLSQGQFLERINRLIENKSILTAEDLKQLVGDNQETVTKISSDTDQLYVILDKTPKVIQSIKQLQPNTLLVGFKLLVDVSKEELLTVATASLHKNQADYVLANDLTSIEFNKHVGYLIDPQGQIIGEVDSKEAIAQLIVQTLLPEFK